MPGWTDVYLLNSEVKEKEPEGTNHEMKAKPEQKTERGLEKADRLGGRLFFRVPTPMKEQSIVRSRVPRTPRDPLQTGKL